MVSRVLVETLRQTKAGDLVDAHLIAQSARTTADIVRATLKEFADPTGQPVRMTSALRIRLALEGAKRGALLQVSRVLTWQEFERFGEDCLDEAGFESQRGIVVKDELKRYQIDLVGVKGETVLSLDCKHWEPPIHPSRFGPAIEHHKMSLGPLVRHLVRNGDFLQSKVWGLPMILTLMRPRNPVIDGVVLVSIEQLSDFLHHLTPYDPEIPFVTIGAESPISQSVFP